MTAATHAWLCNTAPQAPDSELRTSYIVIRTFKLRFIDRYSSTLYVHAAFLTKKAACMKIQAAVNYSLAEPLNGGDEDRASDQTWGRT